MTSNWIYIIFFLIIFIIAIYFKVKEIRSIKNKGIKTSGVIFDIETEFINQEAQFKIPLVRFTTNDGKWITGKSKSVKSFPSTFDKGEEVTVFYNPQNPEEFIIERIHSNSN